MQITFVKTKMEKCFQSKAKVILRAVVGCILFLPRANTFLLSSVTRSANAARRAVAAAQERSPTFGVKKEKITKEAQELLDAFADPSKLLVAQVAPAVR